MSDTTTYDGDEICPDCQGEGCERCDFGGTIATHTEPEPEPRCDAWSIGGDERCLLTVGHTDPHFYAFDLPSGETTEADPTESTTTWTGVPEGVVTSPPFIHPTSYGPITVSDPGTGDVWSGPASPDDDLAVMSDPHSIASSAVRAHPIGAMPSAPIIGPHPPEVDRVAAAARAWYDAPERRRAYLRAYSEAVVNLRACFTVLAEGPSQGDPDWRGRSGDYRDSIAEARHRSGLSDDAWRILTGGARYHVGAMVRKRATPEQLEHADLSPLTPNERGRTR
jgi:hypothetical protein